jgi:hypothetical protein
LLANSNDVCTKFWEFWEFWEFWDQTSNKINVYDDLYKYNPGKSCWTHIRSPDPAGPLCMCRGCLSQLPLYFRGRVHLSQSGEIQAFPVRQGSAPLALVKQLGPRVKKARYFVPTFVTM